MKARAAVGLVLLVSLPVLVGFIWPGTVEYFATRGNRAWRAGNFEAAEKYFARALLADPGNATLTYNRGTAVYRRDQFDHAAEDFRRAAEGGGEDLAGDASYDLGNALFRAGDYEGAISAYQDTLRRDPADMDAKHNLELAQRMKDQQQQNRQDQQDQQTSKTSKISRISGSNNSRISRPRTNSSNRSRINNSNRASNRASRISRPSSSRPSRATNRIRPGRQASSGMREI